MIETLAHKRFFPYALFLFALGLYALNNNNISIYILDEAKNAECAREMLEQNELFKPTFNYHLRKDKPPLHYYFMMLSYSVFGVNEWAARLFSAIFGALTILITFIYTGRFLNKKTALFAALILLASIHLTVQFHIAVPDPYLIFFFCWSLFLFYSAVTTNKLFDKILMYISIALAVLTKGPMAIALPGLIFLLFLIFSKQFKWKTISKLYPLAGVAIVLFIALPWFIVNGVETNWEWTYDFIMRHNLHRFGSEMEGHGGIFLITLAYVIVGLLPFSLFFIPAFRLSWQKKSNKFLLFSLIAASTIIVFFSISQTKLPNYTVPAYPFLAVILAHYFVSLKEYSSKLNSGLIILLVITLALPIAGYFGLKADHSLSQVSPRMWWLLILPAGTLIALIYSLKKNPEKSLLSVFVSFILASVLIFTIIFPAFDKLNPVKQSIGLLQNKKVAYYKKFNASYSFYLKKKIPELQADEIAPFFKKNPDGTLISIKREIEKIQLPDEYNIVFSGRDLFEIPTTVLISKNKK